MEHRIGVERPLAAQIVDRLGRYRRELARWLEVGVTHIQSADLAAKVGATPALVRRDLMTIGYRGAAGRGYEVAGLAATVEDRLSLTAGLPLVLVGIGALGRAVLREASDRQPELRLVAGFSEDPLTSGRRIDGVPIHALRDLEAELAARPAAAAILAVQEAAAQDVADRLVAAGVTSLLNLTTRPLRLPPGIHVESVDLGLSLLRTAFFASNAQGGEA